MFINDINNRYVYLNSMRNVVWEQPADRTPNLDLTVSIHPELVLVLDKLMKERPTWRFKSTERFGSTAHQVKVVSFIIYDGDETLGQLYMENYWRDGAVRYYFDNFRLERARQKNIKNYSTKPDVAAKRIVKAFHLKTPKERAAEAFVKMRTDVQNKNANLGWPLRQAKGTLESELYAYASRNWDEIKPLLGPTAADIDLPTLMDACGEYERLASAIYDAQGRTVRVESNGTYLAARGRDRPADTSTFTTEIYTDNTLPNDLRGPLGLLKLVEDQTYIEGVGFRVDATLYFIMDSDGVIADGVIAPVA